MIFEINTLARINYQLSTHTRLDVGLNYQLNQRIEFNINGSWGKTVLLKDVFKGNEEENYGYSATAKLTDYQIGCSMVHKF